MKALLIKYKLVIRFIFTFLAIYFVLTMAYKLYLDFSDGSMYYPDAITNLVARQSQSLLTSFDYRVELLPHSTGAYLKLIVNEKYVAKMVEGCNAMSVIILFVSFMIAFAGKFKPTLFYTISGSILIYAVNLARISFLSAGLYHYPWRREILHNAIFPLIIYGMVFLLWMFWVNRFSNFKNT
ncbi:exosortase family protein XrtF [Ichthyenterobacterium sp. W332]|uniref:Exosortase family protein XrtF n=1 Tax=Microcosmobacter mediterraneus TaxID=3075607 RepID=A0ABU2YM42_9FLAO|nr:exosortase family protein XrtF [Ichthyenterobacterium sp. W332]MDT0559224.1 exosortase family protein XrtF [Ichthyenterobacterium sp. W332]